MLPVETSYTKNIRKTLWNTWWAQDRRFKASDKEVILQMDFLDHHVSLFAGGPGLHLLTYYSNFNRVIFCYQNSPGLHHKLYSCPVY